MTLQTKIESFHNLGLALQTMCADYENHADFCSVVRRATAQNPWFTTDSILSAIEGICQFLNRDKLMQWLEPYKLTTPKTQYRVGVVMAGNIPMVGFHDLLCVLLTGHKAIVKQSSKDKILMPFVAKLLIEIEPEFADLIEFRDGTLSDFDAILATGSDNSAKYFEFYFKKYPHIIRKNRTSVAVLTGNETDQQIVDLGRDIFMYFGLGCRNVSKLYVPKNYDFAKLLRPMECYRNVSDHFKYNNNYEYNKSIYLINVNKHYDNGFLLVKEDQSIFSPLAVVHYEEYNDIETLKKQLSDLQEKIQCIVSSQNIFYKANVEIGTSQKPQPWDYADNVDTIKFLSSF